MSNDNLKVCVLCKMSKVLEEFNKNKTKKDGLQTICRECNREKSKNYYSNNREKHIQIILDRNKKYRKVARFFVYEYLKNTGCSICKDNDPIVLEFDHLDPSDKKDCISALVHSGNSLISLKNEISKCQVLCANCHRRKTAKDQGWYTDLGL